MTTPTGQISFSQIASEFGTPPGKNIGAYRISQSIAGRNWTLDTGVPTSGQIKFSDLKGKTLNVVVDYSGSTEYNVNSNSNYTTSGTVVGGFRSIPGATQTKKVYHVIRKIIGGNFDSGNWDTNTIKLQYLIDSGQLFGAGGSGGSGSAGSGPGSPGSPGTTSMTIRYPCDIINNGYIQCGYGGGGGGGGTYDNPDKNPQDPLNSGGGGGGGAGLPSGAGGSGGTAAQTGGSNGAAGSAGSSQNGGGGGAGGTPARGGSRGGNGGNGGGITADAGPGGSGTGGNIANGAGGSAGGNGLAIQKTSTTITVTYSGGGTIYGTTNI